MFSEPSLMPTDTGSGYRQPKARLGRKHVRPWKWMTFTNSARNVGIIYKECKKINALLLFVCMSVCLSLSLCLSFSLGWVSIVTLASYY